MQAQKLTKSICVSNFNPKQLDAVISMGGTVRVASRCSKVGVASWCSKQVPSRLPSGVGRTVT